MGSSPPTDVAAPLSAPPRSVRRRLARWDWADVGGRRRGFWAGWGGRITTLTIAALVVALLVGWVLLWVDRPNTSVALLIMGCIAFTLVLALLATLQNKLAAHWRLRQAEAAFLTGISHNLRTPIGAIRAAAQALQGGRLDSEKRQKLLAAIVQETRRLALRVENVLETGRLDVERLAFAPAAMDLGALVGAKVDEARGVVEAREGSIVARLSPATVLGDQRAIGLLVDNVLDNAIKYSDGPPRITIDLLREGVFVLLRIGDEGTGFVPGAETLLFKRFGRGDSGRSGTGLGLSLARSIARGHGGDVHLHSQGRGRGATAEIWLPASEDVPSGDLPDGSRPTTERPGGEG